MSKAISYNELCTSKPSIHISANPLSVSLIEINVSAVCTFNGTDGGTSFAVGGSALASTYVGPPQTQVSGACLAFSFPGQLCPGAIECHPHPPV